ncbi:unnamed protein product [Discosporangium mesarthrocarpum]
MGMVGLEKVDAPEDVKELRGFLEAHHQHTESTVAKRLLDNYSVEVTKFVKVSPSLFT